MRYLVKAKLKPGKSKPLLDSIDSGTLGKGSIAGDEYVYNMKEARVNGDGAATWVETCFCDPPLAEERPYWEEYFELISVKDAHSRRNCRHENGTEPWACCDCDCTSKLEEKLRSQGEPFLARLRCKMEGHAPSRPKSYAPTARRPPDRIEKTDQSNTSTYHDA